MTSWHPSAAGGLLGALLASLVLAALLAGVQQTPWPSSLPGLSPVVLDDAGGLLRIYPAADGRWRMRTDPDDVPPLFLEMLTGYEDRRFRQHHGVDPLAVARALWQAIREGRPVSGASTLTMQTARLLADHGHDLPGKWQQTRHALGLEHVLSKNEILTRYLTLAPFGGNIEGVRAASLAYFGKEPRLLTASESALLIALPQSPETRRPDRFPERARSARDRVLARMIPPGVLTEQEAHVAMQEPMTARRRPIPNAAPHLADRLRARFPNRPEVESFISAALQDAVRRIAREELAGLHEAVNMAVLVVRNRDTAVRAYLGSADFFDSSRAGQVDLARAVRSPGSTLKPVIYGMAFEQLLVHPATLIYDGEVHFGDYAPENFDKRTYGELTVREALARSLNRTAVLLLDEIGPHVFLTRLRSVGLPLRIGAPDQTAGLAVALGGGGYSLWDLASLYAGIANRGEVRPLRLSPDQPQQRPLRLLSREASWALADILAGTAPPEARVSVEYLDRGRRIALKTGTSYGFRDSWAVGFDADHTVAVWAGRPDGHPNPRYFGRAIAAPILYRIFDQLPHPDRDVANGPPPGSILTADRDLPVRLRRYVRGGTGMAMSAIPIPLHLVYPINGAVIEPRRSDSRLLPLKLVADGGKRPYYWLVDEDRLPSVPGASSAVWSPRQLGQHLIEVIDSDGVWAVAEVWIQ
jgi:penicillin-binding protein 1C